jgi:RsiW-degrading membrane proteinase PrsW (M82 family)
VSFEPVLLAPEPEIEEVYPYRRVWRTAWFEVLALFGVTLALYLLTTLFGVLPRDLRDPLPRIGLAVLPLALWFIFSYGGERRALRPRPDLLRVLILGALVANAVAVPLEEYVFLPQRWLPSAGFGGRLLGYAATIGFTAEFLKYLVLRYTIWPRRITQRLDGIAYGLAASVGYALVFNLRFALFTDATLVASALRVASITLPHLAAGAIVGFFLAELWIGRTAVFWLPIGLGVASLVSGLHYAFRAIAIAGSPSVVGTGSSPLLGLLLAMGLVVTVFWVFAFLISSADARAQALTSPRRAL